LGRYRLIFEWRNDGSVGTIPGNVIVIVFIKEVSWYQPIRASVDKASQTSVDVTVITNVVSYTNVSYEYEVRTAGAQGSVSVGFVTSGSSPNATFTVNGLTSGTIYTIYIRTVCGPADKSLYSFYQFVHDPTPLPYEQNFESANHNW